jgi:hypothetical protein
MPLVDKEIPGWLKGAAAGMLLLTVGHFIYQTIFVGWREYQVLVFTDLPFEANEARYDIFVDGSYREKTFFVKPAPDSALGLFGSEPFRSTERRVTLALVPQATNTAHPTYRFAVEGDPEGHRYCEIVVYLRNGAPTVEACKFRDYDARLFGFFLNIFN